HPSMTALKGLYDAGRVAILLGVGYANSSLSHFTGMDIWQTADPLNGSDTVGWLGKYADQYLAGVSGVTADSVGTASLPKTFFATKLVIPNIASFDADGFATDWLHPSGRANQMAVFNAAYNRSFAPGTFISLLTSTGVKGLKSLEAIKNALAASTSTVTY